MKQGFFVAHRSIDSVQPLSSSDIYLFVGSQLERQKEAIMMQADEEVLCDHSTTILPPVDISAAPEHAAGIN